MVPWPILIPSNSPFTLANLPHGIFSTSAKDDKRVGVAVGDFIIDLSTLERFCLDEKMFKSLQHLGKDSVFQDGDLAKFASLPAVTRQEWRETLITWLNDPESPLFDNAAVNAAIFVAMEDAIMHLPFVIRAFTDFMCADVHIENCSRLAASSVVIAGESIHRPKGVLKNQQDSTFLHQLSQMMDYEAEIGIFVGQHLPTGKTITADQADDYIFGFVSLNDWSARDIQFAEMVPLGPLNGKAFATSISPWAVTFEALEEHRCSSTVVDLREGGEARVPHLCHKDAESTWDLELEVSVLRPTSQGGTPILTSRSNLRDLRWSPSQMLAHLSSSGCGLDSDSPSLRTLGCLLELTEGGKKAAGANQDEPLVYLQDGDEVVIDVWNAARTRGFG
ncbi:2-hydroxyhepta-24-diene-17-dioate isomerase [Fusarium albosuccineum]|uniref:Fumarylacetoacetase n=1 Tax=Fusarium albosuccineum TaxID=1237068 RepID=A0A8H4KZY2_9HYPO|nr:2-hydroxyhepta-24-diene-17-dioate isomerase [Fusarium albosuccineum]